MRSAKIDVLMVEPVGGHGGMDYYDFALCNAISENGLNVVLLTCDETDSSKVNFPVWKYFTKIYGTDPSCIVTGKQIGRAHV